MSSLLLAVIALIALAAGYFLYSPRVARWIEVDDNETTPAVEMNDGVDYVPAHHWTVLFGHHFASIAGAAPIIGPVIACLFWGWLPAVIWIVLGGILFGAVHDFAALTLSAKNQGRSVANLAENVLGKGSRIIFSIFVFLALILVVAVFAAVAGLTLETTPEVVIPTFGLVLVALLTGFSLYHLKWPLWLCSLLGLVLLFFLIIAGYNFPVRLPVKDPSKWWTAILLIYGLIASVTPVTLLLQPRDHLAASVLFVGMVIGFLGLALTNPEINAPPVVNLSGGKGWLWPMMFVTIACGALSGFHSLVASGTTSKQLPRMRDSRVIGYGGMLTESALSVLAVIAVTAGLYWKAAPAGAAGAVYQDVFAEGGWINAFGTGYDNITRGLLEPAAAWTGIGTLGMLIGITMLKTFVMTTLDSATRITRYISVELFGEAMGLKFMKNKYAATALVGILAAPLALGKWKAIWPVFGAANQLIASVVLIVVSIYLLDRKRKYLFAAVPALLVLVTTMGALVYNIHTFLNAPGGPNWLLAATSCALMILGLLIFANGIARAIRTVKQQNS